MGIEPTSEAWEASILPLYDARSFVSDCTQKLIFRTTVWKSILSRPRGSGSQNMPERMRPNGLIHIQLLTRQ